MQFLFGKFTSKRNCKSCPEVFQNICVYIVGRLTIQVIQKYSLDFPWIFLGFLGFSLRTCSNNSSAQCSHLVQDFCVAVGARALMREILKNLQKYSLGKVNRTDVMLLAVANPCLFIRCFSFCLFIFTIFATVFEGEEG